MDLASYCTDRFSWWLNETRAGRRSGVEEGFCTSLVGNVFSAPFVRPLADSVSCGDTRQQWPIPSQAGLTK
jgi:hypothetical protein